MLPCVNAYRSFFIRLGRHRWFSSLTVTLLVPVDRFLYQRSRGHFSLLHLGRRGVAFPSLLLTTKGRKTGEPRSATLLYIEEPEGLVVVGSNFGQARHPAWSGNLLANPQAEVVIRGERRSVTARAATEEEKERLWPKLLAVYPTWQDYTTRTDRSFRAFYLEPRSQQP